jgi:hypothetical protein
VRLKVLQCPAENEKSPPVPPAQTVPSLSSATAQMREDGRPRMREKLAYGAVATNNPFSVSGPETLLAIKEQRVCRLPFEPLLIAKPGHLARPDTQTGSATCFGTQP